MHNHSDDNNLENIASLIPADDECRRVAGSFQRLGDGTRLKIFSLLCHSEQCVMNIAELIGMSSPAVAHHLRVLKEGNLITSRRIGREIHYTLSNSPKAIEMHRSLDILFSINCK